MRSLVILFLALIHVLALPMPAAAQDYAASRVVAVERWIEEWDEESQSWVRISESEVVVQRASARAERFSLPQLQHAELATSHAIAGHADRFGPFRVLDEGRAALVGTTDSFSPGHFEQMLQAHPAIEVLELVEAPGTRDDVANLRLGRMIRAAGLVTHVPAGGSVRSGAVELFLAGADRKLDEGAEFAVHAWMDNFGRQPGDFAPDAPANRLYLDYYEEMGMTEARAREFYAMTNSVPHNGALWLDAGEMRSWIAPDVRAIDQDNDPQLAYLDVATSAAILAEGETSGFALARLDLAVAFP